MQDCPHRSEFLKLLKTSPASAMLTDPFPNLDTNMVATNPASSSQVLMLSVIKPKSDFLVST